MPQNALLNRFVLGSVVWLGGTACLVAQENPVVGKTPEQLFGELDTDKDGTLTAAEVGPEGKEAYERLLRVGDKDGDGGLTLAEFVTASKPSPTRPVPPPSEGTGGPGPRGAFDPAEFAKRLDRNADGKITLDELPERMREQAGKVFERAGAQELSLEEFGQAMRGLLRNATPGNPGQAGRTPFEYLKRMDRNGDGKISVEEIPEPLRERMQPLFDRASASELSIERIQELMARMAGGGQPGQPGPMGQGRFAPAFLRQLDTNGDGKLSQDELKRFAEIFADLDSDGDGALDLPELMGGPRIGPDGPGRPRGPLPEAPASSPRPDRPRRPDGAGETAAPARRASPTPGDPPRTDRPAENPTNSQARLRRLDTNGDGKLSRDETRGRLQENFDKLDLNQDGYLDQSEVRKALQQLGGSRPGNRAAAKKPQKMA